ncbi:MAG: hypothetical protein ACLFNP_03690 [Spirochaetaceae bacterium]
MKNLRSTVIVTVSAALLLGACATERGSSPAQTEEPAPDWVMRAPEPTDQYEYFVGSSSDESGDTAAAEDQAIADLIAEITRYLGVRVTSETSAEARASLNSFESEVTQTVRQQSEARVAGFRVQDRYVEEQAGRVTVHILARYERSALEAEKRRLEALFQERIDAIAVPEEEAENLESRGAYVRAAQKYIEAAAAAASSDIENAQIRFERNISAARNILSELTIEKLDDNLSALVGSPFDERFRARVTVGGRPLEDVEMLVGYKVLRSNGRTGVSTSRVRTNDEGVAAFQHPVPEFVGTESLTMGLDLDAYLTPLQDAPRSYQSDIDGLLDVLASKRVVFRYSVESGAGSVPTAVVVLATDIAGNPIRDGATESGILQRLSSEGFDIRVLSFPREELNGMSDADLLEEFRRVADPSVRRVVYGVVGIDEFEERDGVIVRVSGQVRTVRLSDGEVLAVAEGFQRSRGLSSQSAISAAFRGLGNKFAEQLMRELP